MTSATGGGRRAASLARPAFGEPGLAGLCEIARHRGRIGLADDSADPERTPS